MVTKNNQGQDLKKNLGAYFKEVFRKNGVVNIDRGIVKSHFFILNRYISIKYPLVAEAFNTNKIDPINASLYLNQAMSNIYTRVPNWLWIKWDKTVSSDVTKLKRLKKAIVYYMDQNMIGSNDFYYKMKNNPEQTLAILRRYDKFIKENQLEIEGNFVLDPNKLA